MRRGGRDSRARVPLGVASLNASKGVQAAPKSEFVITLSRIQLDDADRARTLSDPTLHPPPHGCCRPYSTTSTAPNHWAKLGGGRWAVAGGRWAVAGGRWAVAGGQSLGRCGVAVPHRHNTDNYDAVSANSNPGSVTKIHPMYVEYTSAPL